MTAHEQILFADIQAEEEFLNTLAALGPGSKFTEAALKKWGDTRRAYVASLGEVILEKATAKRKLAGLEV